MHGNKPLYIVIMEEIRQKIKDKAYDEHDKLPTEIDLAKQYEVSRITSKRALLELEKQGLVYRKRGSGSYVRPQLKPSEVVKGQTAMQTRIISMLLPWSSTGRLDYIQGANDYLDPRGYLLSIHISGWNVDKEKELLLKMWRNGHSGIILYPSSSVYNIAIVNAINTNGFPIVLMDQYYDSAKISSVVSDNQNGGYLATEMLINKGHTSIAFISSIRIDLRSTVRDRYLGYCAAHKDKDLPINLDFIISDVYTGLADKERAGRLAALIKELEGKGVTAIQAEHDDLAVDLLVACKQTGIQVPGTMSIVGFDNEESAMYAPVPLTTVGQNYYEIGHQAARLIVEQIENDNKEYCSVIVPVQWVERDSVRSLLEEGETIVL